MIILYWIVYTTAGYDLTISTSQGISSHVVDIFLPECWNCIYCMYINTYVLDSFVCVYSDTTWMAILFLSPQYNVTESSSDGVMTYHADFQRSYRAYHVKVTVDRGSATSCATVELKGMPADGEELN